VLGAFGTNNSYTSKDVINRWNYITKELASEGITAKFASDGDPKLLGAMKSLSSFGRTKFIDDLNINLICDLDSEIKCMQDNIHLANKLKNRLFDSANNLEIGNFCASINHVRMMLDDPNLSINDHLLVSSDVNTNDNTRDKMNYESTKKICSDEVIKILSEKIEGSEGTVAYIKVIRSVLKAYIELDIDPLTRLYYAYFGLSFIRRWKNDLEYINEDNFVTSNVWTCMELNFASLLNLVLKGQGQMVLIWNSQSCEELFRSLRSISTFGLTEINFSLLEGLEKINRVHKIQVLSNKLKDIFQLPENLEKKSDRSVLRNMKMEQPSREDCKVILEKASNDAMELCKSLKMKNFAECDPSLYLNSAQASRKKKDDLTNIESEKETNVLKIKNMFFIDDSSGKCLKYNNKV